MFLKYWHTDLLDSMLIPFKIKAVKLQAWWRMKLARKRFRPILRAYRDMLAIAVNFIDAIADNSRKFSNAMRAIGDEEKRRGLEELGLTEKLTEKEVAKLQKKVCVCVCVCVSVLCV
jgi:hypothetical protein